jgi:hypothetical protein
MAKIVQETVRTAETEAGVPDPRVRRARERVQAIRGFYIHLGIYLIVNVGIFALNWALVLVNGASQGWFFYWPLIAWGIAVLINGFVVFGSDRFLGPDWEERKVHEYMARKG